MIWEIEVDPFVVFRDTVLPTSPNTYTVTGLMDYGNTIFSISVTAHNAVGSATSTNLCVEANFAVGSSTTTPDEAQDASHGEAIIGPVVAGSVIIAIALIIIVAVLVYCYNLKSKKNNILKPDNM